MNHLLFLPSLLFMNFGYNQFIDYQVGNCSATKTDGKVGRCNRVFNNGPITSTDIQHIKYFFNDVPFTWVIDEQNKQDQQLLKGSSLVFKGHFPALFLDLEQLVAPRTADVTVREIAIQDDGTTWISIASQNYHYLHNKAEFAKALHFLKNRAQENITFYVGYYKDVPAATSMIVYHGDYVSIHFVGTLEQFRHKGLGRSMIAIPLSIAKDRGYHSAILMSSPEGLPIAKHLGFEEYRTYTIYGNY